MTAKSVIVIGAGLAGLSASCYAGMNGYDVKVFEHASRSGGVAATWKRKGYTIDGGIHFYMGIQPGSSIHELYRELGVYREDRFRVMGTYADFLYSDDGSRISVTRDPDRTAADLKALSPEDGRFIDDFFRGVKALGRKDVMRSLFKPPELTTLWDRIRNGASMWKTVKYFMGRYMLPVEEAVKGLKSPAVRWVFESMFLPGVPLVFPMMLLGALANGDLAVRTDGTAGFVGALEQRAKDLGAEIRYRATVEEILIENDRAIGARLSNGEIQRADRVVSAADGYSTVYELLGGRYISKALQKAHETWPLFKPIVMIHYGVTRAFENEPRFLVVKPKREVAAGRIGGAWSVTLFRHSDGFAPLGRTLVQVMIESDWDYWRGLRDDIEAYQEEKKRVAEQVLAALSDVWPGIDGTVDMTDIATPYTWWRYTFNRKGAYEGFMLTPERFSATIPRRLPGLKNFVMAGQWTAPGGGAVPSLLTGRHAAMIMCREDGKSFTTRKTTI